MSRVDREGGVRHADLATTVLLLGSTSKIRLAIVRELAHHRQTRPLLFGDSPAAGRELLAGLQRAGCLQGDVGLLDTHDPGTHEQTLRNAFQQAGTLDTVIVATGDPDARSGLDVHHEEALEIMRVNFVACASLVLHCARNLRRQGGGMLIVLSRALIAGRGRL